MEQSKYEGQPITFAFYKNGTLMGYREDTAGSIGNHPKIYHYSKDQVETVLKNINYNVTNPAGSDFGEFLTKAGYTEVGEIIYEAHRELHERLQGERAFEVRVLKCPENNVISDIDKEVMFAAVKGIEGIGDAINSYKSRRYPHETMGEWLQHPETHEVIEIHPFSINGLLNQQ